ncbi:MAG: translation elongation factor Ts [Bacteroidota bacterium]
MTKITATEVNNLRKQTGAGMMDCKIALVEAEGDFEKAIIILRKKGKNIAAKREGREAIEGLVLAKFSNDGEIGAVIVLNCETDFVAKNNEFVQLANLLVDLAIENKPASIDNFKSLTLNKRSVEESIIDLTGKTGEKIELSHYEIIESDKVFAYNHPGNRLASLVGLNKKTVKGIDEIGKEVAMQIAAMNPVAIDKDDVDKEIIERELEIGKEQAKREGKPENILEKIALGKLNKFYKESTLLNQEYIKDRKITIRQLLLEADKDLRVTSFKRFALGN